MWTKTPDGSIQDASGKVIFFSAQRFVDDICLGHCCFICGAKPGSKPFNNEHILPAWLLRRFNLFDRTITLPYGHKVRYGTYTVPCCQDCNSLMGTQIETPISAAMAGGLSAINAFVEGGDLLKLYVWMGLIYLKTHLKDRAMRIHLDKREGEEKIGDDYNWADLHHIHSVVRSFCNGCFVEKEALGSFLTISVTHQAGRDRFDFSDLYLAQTMVLCVDDCALFAVFNDSGGALSRFYPQLTRISGPLSHIQMREVMAELAFLNLSLKERPTFHTECDMEAETSRIFAVRPELDLVPVDLRMRGRLLRHALYNVPEGMQFAGVAREEALAAIDAGTMTFLFDDNGEFIKESMTSELPVPES
ncbi:conserved hypothetical protein [Parvibaculum lavamentivorans DS-1]|uniref:Uncharacterized protein n=1 Tax=Parvibaculum lavamentivorans (strain DS-1 / DSM 13023 / NCIMB 13966) TaxID=402881 RepID=A7HVM1_PARL1|nr:hypothetical protein [Parvibaculum lavamentivorans]ABS63954.1 conserved hypothetical protein [Parvibaculum lavamentivorans DS-1]